MARYAIFGDSYVNHLEKHCRKIGRPMNNLGGECRFFGVPGMTTRRKFDDAFQQMLRYKPDYVFVNLGGNDIDATTLAADIVDRLLNITNVLKKRGARRVLLASIIKRGKVRHTSVAHFNKVRNCINKKLRKRIGREFVDVMKKVRYPVNYDKDLVHPGGNGGMENFRNLVHRCLLAAPNM